MNYVLYHKIPYFLVPVLRFYPYTLYKYSLIVYYELITFPCINLMCLIYVLYSLIFNIICILLSRLILYSTCCYLMTSSVSTLVDLWNTE